MTSEMGRHEVTTTKTTFSGLSATACFRALANSIGRDRVFILESLSNYSCDSEISLIGIQPVLQICSRETRIDVIGPPSIATAVLAAIYQQPGVTRISSQSVRLSDQSQIWETLRLVQNIFDWRDADRGDEFSFGFFGYLGYDVAWSIERLPRRIDGDRTSYDLHLGIYQGVIEFDRLSDRGTIRVNNSDLWPTLGCEDLLVQMTTGSGADLAYESGFEVEEPRNVAIAISRESYMENVERAKEHISIGDIYQVQLGYEIAIRSAVDPASVYWRMREKNPSPFMYLAQVGPNTIVGASPELFVRVVDGRVTMRPIAGTIRRGKDKAENDALVARMMNDEKEIAEHIMLVDLCRNDIGRICKAGTLSVPTLMEVATYSHVNHLVSTVTGEVRDAIDSFDVIKATFPAGTMTGAPKIRAMEIIENLEQSRRGVYSGAVGVIGFDGYVNMALCIRSATYDGDQYMIRASAGIVADSLPAREWDETVQKMAASYWAITGRELQNEGSFN